MSLKTFFFGSFSTDALSDATLELAAAERKLLHARSVVEDYTAQEQALELRIRRLRAVVQTKDAMSKPEEVPYTFDDRDDTDLPRNN